MGQRFALITYHGSVVHLDRATRTLRHAPIWLCDPNVWLTRDGATAELTFHDGAQERVVDDYRPDVCGIAATGGSAELGAVSVGTDLLALHIDGRYMCAEASGAIAMSRSVCTTRLTLRIDPSSRFASSCAMRGVLPPGRARVNAPVADGCVRLGARGRDGRVWRGIDTHTRYRRVTTQS